MHNCVDSTLELARKVRISLCSPTRLQKLISVRSSVRVQGKEAPYVRTRNGVDDVVVYRAANLVVFVENAAIRLLLINPNKAVIQTIDIGNSAGKTHSTERIADCILFVSNRSIVYWSFHSAIVIRNSTYDEQHQQPTKYVPPACVQPSVDGHDMD